MTSDSDKRSPPILHAGDSRSSPYPVSRLAPGFGLTDLAREIEQADTIVSGRLNAELQVIARQVKSLQEQAREILARARADQRLHHARCAFKRIPGHVYHLYEEADGGAAFSMLSPDDWGGQPPKPFIGSYRLETDMSWTAWNGIDDPQRDDSRQLVNRLLAASDTAHSGGDEP